MTDLDIPICAYCGLEQFRHEPNDHVFDAIGGSIVGPSTLEELAREHPLPSIGPWYTTFELIDWALLAALMVVIVVSVYVLLR